MIEWLDQFWQSLHPAVQVVIGGLVVAAIVGIVTLVVHLIRKWIVPSPEKKKRHDDRLKVHFQELKKEAQEIMRVISRVTENQGKIVSHSPAIHSEITDVVLPQLSDAFMAHFPEETEECRKYEQRIKEHNQGQERFRLKVLNSIKSQDIPVVTINSTVTPCVYNSIFAPLFQRWKELAKGRRPSPDFSKIQQVDVGDGYIHLYPENWESSTIARVRGEKDKEKYERILHEVAENKTFEEEATQLIRDANQLVEQTGDFCRKVSGKLNDVDKLWPGTKKYEFKEAKGCPRCKELFPNN